MHRRVRSHDNKKKQSLNDVLFFEVLLCFTRDEGFGLITVPHLNHSRIKFLRKQTNEVRPLF